MISIIILASCESETPEPKDQFCLLSKYYSSGDTSQTSTKFYYNSDDRLSRIIMPSPAGTTWGSNFVYSGNTIVITDIADPSNYTKYFLSSDTLAISSSVFSQGIRTDTVNYFYNADKFLVKAVRFNHVTGKDSTLLTYVNNNLVSLRFYVHSGASAQATFEYSTIDAKGWFDQNFGQYLPYDRYYPWFGRSSAKLIQSFSSDFNGNPQPVQLSYDTNPSGYVTKLTTTHLGNVSQANFEYACR